MISLFHYVIRPEGYLVLGTSEGIGGATNLFGVEDRALKIFSKRTTAGRQIVTFSLNRAQEPSNIPPSRMPGKAGGPAWNYMEAQKEFDRRVLTQFAPPSAFINEDMEVVHTRGNVSRYLKIASGRASLNVLKMACEGLLFDLRNAISRARKEKTTVHKHQVQVRIANGNGSGDAPSDGCGRDSARLVDLEVIPVSIGNLKELYFMILFKESSEIPTRTQRAARAEKQSESATRQVSKLQQELEATKEYLQW